MAKNGIFKQPYQELEERWADYIGTNHAVACSSGTAGLHLALASMGIKPGDEVIVPEFTMIATAWAVTYLGAKPVFVDCGPDLNIDPAKIEAAITDKTKAIMITHIYGRPCKMDAIMKIANDHWLDVIEDACEAHGATYQGKKVGSFGSISVFSLYRNKIIQSEEGGLINTDEPGTKNALDNLKSMGFGKDHDYFHPYLAYNYRMTNMQATQAISELGQIHYKLQQRQEFADYLDQELKQWTIKRPKGSVIWVYDMVFENQPMRDKIFKKLTQKGMEPRLFFKPMSQQPMYFDEKYKQTKAHMYASRGLYLPFTTEWTKLNEIINIIKQSHGITR